MLFINQNGVVKRADGKTIHEVVILSKSQFPETGEENVVYIASDENKIYYFDASTSSYIVLADTTYATDLEAKNALGVE